MLRSARELFGYALRAVDHSVGSVHDFYLEVHTLDVRHVAVDLGRSHHGRYVLLAPSKARTPDRRSRTLPVSLTVGEVWNCPTAGSAVPVLAPQERVRAGRPSPDADHECDAALLLGSVRRLIKTPVRATDSYAGRVADVIVDTAAWVVRHVVIQTRRWPFRLPVLLSEEQVRGLHWFPGEVAIDATADQIQAGTPFHSDAPVNCVEEVGVYDFLGRSRGCVSREPSGEAR